MKIIKKYMGKIKKPINADFFARFWETSWIYIKTVVDVVRQPILILDENFCVVAANESFYKTFKTKVKDTEGKVVYELGNGQWDIPALRKLLEDILPKHVFFNGFQVAHEFPSIGRKVMILNARQMHVKEGAASEAFPSIILLAMEDVTDMMAVAESLSGHAKEIEAKLMARTHKLESHIGELAREINKLKKKG